MFAGTYAPLNWAFCEGQLLSISEYSTLFAIIGTNYGGDGRTNFALPDLRGRVPVSAGIGPGLSPYYLGQEGGVETVPLSLAQMPSHKHDLMGSSAAASDTTPEENLPATTSRTRLYTSSSENDVNMGSEAISNNGGSQPHENRQPYSVVHYIICVDGLWPSRP